MKKTTCIQNLSRILQFIWPVLDNVRQESFWNVVKVLRRQLCSPNMFTVDLSVCMRVCGCVYLVVLLVQACFSQQTPVCVKTANNLRACALTRRRALLNLNFDPKQV